MSEQADDLERRIDQLRTALRSAVRAAERDRVRALRAELRTAEQAWHALFDTDTDIDAGTDTGPGTDIEPGAEHAPPETSSHGSTASYTGNQTLLPLREQVHEALRLLTVPATPKLIATVHEAFFAATFASSKLTSLKRDEERSFRLAPYARPYYLCAALTADRLSPVRGLLAVSTWPGERRVIGSLSPRVDFLVSAINIASAVDRLPDQADITTAQRLLARFAANIPGAPKHPATLDTRAVIEAAQAELAVHEPDDSQVRRTAAQRAREQLDDAAQLFGARFEQLGNQQLGNQRLGG